MLHEVAVTITGNFNVKVEGRDWHSRQKARAVGREWGEDVPERFDVETYEYGCKIIVDTASDHRADPRPVRDEIEELIQEDGKVHVVDDI